MFDLLTKFEAHLDPRPVRRAADKAAFRNLSHAAASIRKDAIASIKPEDGPSPAGTPPHTHTQTQGGKRKGVLPRAIVYAVDKQSAVIGPRATVAGETGEPHEFGGRFRGQSYPRRPFMGPALARAVPRIGSQWTGTIGPA